MTNRHLLVLLVVAVAYVGACLGLIELYEAEVEARIEAKEAQDEVPPKEIKKHANR